MAANATQCPVVGTTNSVLPPNHPSIDLNQPGQTCPVVGAKTEHHHNLHQHPPVPIDHATQDTATLHAPSAAACPVVNNMVKEPKSQAMDDDVCPVIGPATTVLPPDHPDMSGKAEGEVCPVTKAKVGHHKGKVHGHPSVQGAAEGAVCPVAGVKI
ncbi:hypothetical protein GQ43DRAFT_438627 [Delitschia confertaspora ATCC 74209]|uniref:Uncharacterized protein n=1 Tax=Delitschia confertaspora ATCC 74209 TaxID=1513339 RepID=A0A9P4JQ16_9PLEO|nr:hypothetical protein GQ43DRAFT_438627 [Delitschia confertaspora ATCC 74209]